MAAKLFTTIVLIFTLLFQNAGAKPVTHSEDIILKAVLISDIHADADFTRDRTNRLREIISAVGNTQNDADTLVMSGDLTNSGDLREYINLFNILNAYGRINNRIPELGNHDSWHHSDDPDYAKAEKYFKNFCRWNGIKTDKVYYTRTVNGIPFIVLGVEDSDFGEPYHSREQIEWFEEKLTAAVKGGQPVFVICHKPVESLGESSAQIEQILTQSAETAVAPVIYVSGHNHDIGENTFSQKGDRLIYLNLPSVQYTDDGGLGFTAEITGNSVHLTGMNFLTGNPLEGYEYSIPF